MYKLLFVALIITFLISIALFALQKKEFIQPKAPTEEPLKNFEELTHSYSYYEEEVYYENKDAGILISGTLALPKSQRFSSVVLLIPGYGKHDRNVRMMGNNYFWVVADYLANQGVGVLRFDQRGLGKSTGNYDGATTQDFAEDVLAVISYLKSRKDVTGCTIGLIGLSEGGLIASIVAAKSKDVSYIVLMGPAVQKSVDDLVEQSGLQLRADAATEELMGYDRELRKKIYTTIRQETDYDKAEKIVQNYVTHYLASLSESQKIEAEKLPFAFSESKKDTLIKTFNSAWYHFFLTYDRTAALETITILVLAVNGTLDWIASTHKVFPVISQSLEKAGNKDYMMIELPNLNHMFQKAKTGSFAEYAAIDEIIVPLALETIAHWILKKTVKNK